MKTRSTLSVIVLCFTLCFGVGKAQMTAMDFQGPDCNGNMQHLFADLDAGNAVILEFFMQNCTPCDNAGNKLETMKSDLLAQFPGKVKSYAIGYTNSYSCSSIQNWVNNNGFTAIPMDSGAAQLTYYGGFGMPTIVILGGGSSRQVLGSPYIGFTTSDTTQMASDIRAFLNTATGIDNALGAQGISLYPNPTRGDISFHYVADAAGELTVDVMDLTGRKVMDTNTELVAAGEMTKLVKASSLPAGTYLLRTSLNGAVQVEKFTVSR